MLKKLQLSKVITLSLAFILVFSMLNAKTKKAKKEKKVAPKETVEFTIPAKATDSIILVDYDGGKITKTQLDDRINSIPAMYQSKVKTTEGQTKLLENMIYEDLFYIEGLKMGLDKDPTIQNTIKAGLKNIYVDNYLKREIEAKIVITDKDKSDFYDKNKKMFLTRSNTTIKYIQAKNDSAATAILAELKAGKSFHDLIKKYSIANSKDKGGKVTGIRNTGNIPGIGKDPQLDSLIAATAVDTINFVGPVKTKTGTHFFKVMDRVPEIQKTFNEVSSEIENRLRPVMTANLLTDLLDKEYVKYNVKIKKDVIDALKDPNYTKENQGTLVASSDLPEGNLTVKQLQDLAKPRQQQEEIDFSSPDVKVKLIKEFYQTEILYANALQANYEKLLETNQEVITTKRNAIIRAAYQKLVVQGIEIKDEEVRNYYEANKKDKFVIKPTRKIQAFYYDAKDKKIAEKARKDLLKFIKKGQEDKITELYRLSKDGNVKKDGTGTIENIYKNNIIPLHGQDSTYSRIVWSLTKKDEVSEIFTNIKGNFTIIRFLEEKAESIKPFEEVERGIKGNLSSEKVGKKFEEFTKQLMENYHVKKYLDNLATKMTAKELFEQAENAQKQTKFKEAVYYYDQIIKDFVNGQDDYKAWFMKAFIMAEDMNQKDAAIKLFEELKQKWPKGDMNDSADYMVKTIKGEEDPTKTINEK